MWWWRMKLPKYINCKDNTEPCEYYLNKKCEERCPYAMEMKCIGIGAIDNEIAKGLIKKLAMDKIKRRKE